MEDVSYIKTKEVDGGRHTAARNQYRVLVEVESASGNTSVRHVLLHEGDTAKIEFYADELPALAADVRDDKQKQAWKAAEEFARGKTREWLEEHYPEKAKSRKGIEPLLADPDAKWRKQCNVHPAIFLSALGYKKGIGALERADVIHPTEESRRVPLARFMDMAKDEQSEWLIDPPMTAANAHVIAADINAQAMAKAFASFNQSQQAQASKGSGRKG